MRGNDEYNLADYSDNAVENVLAPMLHEDLSLLANAQTARQKKLTADLIV